MTVLTELLAALFTALSNEFKRFISEYRRILSEVFTELNHFFFDVEPGEPVDWPSAISFYGCISLGIALLLLIAYSTFTIN
jgi:hypothetical protein